MAEPATMGEAKAVKPRSWGWLMLFASTSTLICCALPILLVSLGLGAVSAAMFSTLPFLATLAHYKIYLFMGSGVMLLLGLWLVYRPGRACPSDPMLAAQCESVHRWNKRLLWFSASIWGVGFFAAFLSLPLLELYWHLSGQ